MNIGSVNAKKIAAHFHGGIGLMIFLRFRVI